MDSTLIALKLLLDAMGIESTVETLDQRKTVQKAVYLGQRAGVDLGYRFGWYLMGPYSSDLARDYYALDAELRQKANLGERQLNSKARAALGSVRGLLELPAGLDFSRSDWLELLASFDYLTRISRLSSEEAEKVITRDKQHLSRGLVKAREVLRQAALPEA